MHSEPSIVCVHCTAHAGAVNRTRTPWIILMSHRPMYCSPSSLQRGAHLGWPKQPEPGRPGASVGPEPKGYGAGFAAEGLLPPVWDPLAEVYQDRRTTAAGAGGVSANTMPPCGAGDLIRNGMLRANGTGRDYGIEPLMAKHHVDMYHLRQITILK